MLKAIAGAGEAGLPFADLTQAAGAYLSDEERKNLGSLGWHVTTVKLELEVRGEIARVDTKGPQRLIVS